MHHRMAPGWIVSSFKVKNTALPSSSWTLDFVCVIVCVHCTYREWIKDRLEDEKGVNGPQESKDLDAFILLIQHAESIWHLCNFHELSLRKYLIRSCISHLISHYFLSQAALIVHHSFLIYLTSLIYHRSSNLVYPCCHFRWDRQCGPTWKHHQPIAAGFKRYEVSLNALLGS